MEVNLPKIPALLFNISLHNLYITAAINYSKTMPVNTLITLVYIFAPFCVAEVDLCVAVTGNAKRYLLTQITVQATRWGTPGI